MNSRQMLRADPLPTGFWWVNKAKLGAKPRWAKEHQHTVACTGCGALNNSTKPHTFCGGCYLCGRPHWR